MKWLSLQKDTLMREHQNYLMVSFMLFSKKNRYSVFFKNEDLDASFFLFFLSE